MLEVSDELEQARKDGNKIYITDIAIKKVRYIEYKDLTDAQNAVMQRLAKEVLSDFLWQTEGFLFWLWSVIREKYIICTKIKNILRGKQYNCLMSV